ncbi:MAG: nucleotidyltransferase domain-containing protein [Pyrobaculum sp.]
MDAFEWRRRLREEALAKARRIADRVEGTVFLIGSYARGDFSEDSDVDLLVVSRFSEPPHRRLLDVWEPGAEVVALTVEEALRAVEKCYPLARDVALGIVLRDDLKIAAELVKKAKRCI